LFGGAIAPLPAKPDELYEWMDQAGDAGNQIDRSGRGAGEAALENASLGCFDLGDALKLKNSDSLTVQFQGRRPQSFALIHKGWQPSIKLEQGLAITYN
jgi:hypothetical protein